MVPWKISHHYDYFFYNSKIVPWTPILFIDLPGSRRHRLGTAVIMLFSKTWTEFAQRLISAYSIYKTESHLHYNSITWMSKKIVYCMQPITFAIKGELQKTGVSFTHRTRTRLHTRKRKVLFTITFTLVDHSPIIRRRTANDPTPSRIKKQTFINLRNGWPFIWHSTKPVHKHQDEWTGWVPGMVLDPLVSDYGWRTRPERMGEEDACQRHSDISHVVASFFLMIIHYTFLS